MLKYPLRVAHICHIRHVHISANPVDLAIQVAKRIQSSQKHLLSGTKRVLTK